MNRTAQERQTVVPRQFSRSAVLAVWAAAAVPMALLAWVVAPAMATGRPFFHSLVVALTVGLAWQCALVLALVAHEQRSLSWRILRDALWLRAPTDASGRSGGWLWWWVVPFAVGLAVLELIPFRLLLPAPENRNFDTFLASAEGRETFSGNWGLYAVVLLMLLLNTVLGEELLFRGLLLPRMRDAFGRADWIVNGVLAGLYHLHQPWTIPRSIIAHTLLFAYPARRFRSAWLGIIIHSTSSIFTALVLLSLVLA